VNLSTSAPESGRLRLALAGLAGLALMTAAFYPMR
jgi:hypothetical protein